MFEAKPSSLAERSDDFISTPQPYGKNDTDAVPGSCLPWPSGPPTDTNPAPTNGLNSVCIPKRRFQNGRKVMCGGAVDRYVEALIGGVLDDDETYYRPN